MKKKQPTKDQKKQLAALDAIRDVDIDLSDIPDQANKSGWVRASMYRPLMRAISIRLPVPDIALAQDLAARKGLPYQTYIKQLLHDALDRERPGRWHALTPSLRCRRVIEGQVGPKRRSSRSLALGPGSRQLNG